MRGVLRPVAWRSLGAVLDGAQVVQDVAAGAQAVAGAVAAGAVAEAFADDGAALAEAGAAAAVGEGPDPAQQQVADGPGDADQQQDADTRKVVTVRSSGAVSYKHL